MKKQRKIIGTVLLLLLAIVALAGWYLHRHTIAVLQPAGEIGQKERNLMVFTVLISLVVVIPVFVLLAFIAWRYREGNQHARYSPDMDGNRMAEAIWWAIPTIIIGIISVVTWRSSYALDPFKPLSSPKSTLHVQVVALDWKWLFIYPGQNVASVNEAAVPINTPVDFELTSNTVMTSFWDPQLGGQMYAMPGMATQLNLMADKTGSFPGSAANISGAGFAHMTFTVKSMPQSGFNSWVSMAKHSHQDLTYTSYYRKLSRPSIQSQPSYYASAVPGLYNNVIMQHMMPPAYATKSAGGTAQAAETAL